MGSHLFGSNHMSLGLSQLGSQISPLQNQNPPSSNMLRLGSAGGAKFEHLISPSNPSSFGQPPQSMHSSSLFIQDANQGFPNKPQLHGLMQLPDLQSNSSNSSPAASLFNLSFFPNNNSSPGGISSGDNVNISSTNLSSSGLLMQDQLNNSNGGSQGTTLFSTNMGDHVGSGVSSLYSNSLPPENITSHMSATALLQKAAQMGSTTSSNNSSSMLRGLASSKSEKQNVLANFGVSFGNDNGGESLRSHIESGNHLQGLMNSLANASSSMFGRGQDNNFGGFNGSGVTLDQHHSNTNFSTVDEAKLHQNLAVNFGGSDKLTLDFLGVGGMVRNMGGGYSQREQHAINMSSLEPELKTAQQASQAFGSTTMQ